MNNEVRPCLKSQLVILLLFKIVLVVAILLNSNGNLAQNLHATSFFTSSIITWIMFNVYVEDNPDSYWVIRTIFSSSIAFALVYVFDIESLNYLSLSLIIIDIMGFSIGNSLYELNKVEYIRRR